MLGRMPVVVLMGCALLMPGAAAVAQDHRGSAVVQTDRGAVRGIERDGTVEFLGIPFAAPPTGELRWSPPEPAEPWRGTRDATRPGNRCPQHASFGSGTPASATEDCLYLNVTMPATSGRKPVMVWMHGGGFVEGSGAEYDPVRLSRLGDVVVVTVNYRLGIFGNFGYPGLAGSGSFGLMDQQAALRWVQRNAAAFGGNPGNVTVFGESAGGQSVCAQLASPAADGLFQRAIIQSAFCTVDIPANALAPGLPQLSPWEPLTSLVARGRETATALGCAELTCLRELETQEIMPKFNDYAGLSFGGPTLPEHPHEAFQHGRVHRVPVISGFNRDEMTYMQGMYELLTNTDLSEEQLRQYIEQAFGGYATEVGARYPRRAGVPAGRTWAEITTDSGFACPTLGRNQLLARRMPTYGYEFADRTAPPTLGDPGFRYDAYHGAELLYLFDLRFGAVPPKLTVKQRRLGDLMIRYWATFAKTGDPNSLTLPHWPRGGVTQAFEGASAHPTAAAARHQCGFWRTVGFG